jgi:hypothetical protein
MICRSRSTISSIPFNSFMYILTTAPHDARLYAVSSLEDFKTPATNSSTVVLPRRISGLFYSRITNAKKAGMGSLNSGHVDSCRNWSIPQITTGHFGRQPEPVDICALQIGVARASLVNKQYIHTRASSLGRQSRDIRNSMADGSMECDVQATTTTDRARLYTTSTG